MNCPLAAPSLPSLSKFNLSFPIPKLWDFSSLHFMLVAFSQVMPEYQKRAGKKEADCFRVEI